MTDPRADYLLARRDSIREAAERVFVRRGFDGATIQEIADEAGVSAGSIYRYFDSKSALIRAVADGCKQRYAGQFGESGTAAYDPLALLIGAGERIWGEFAGEQARDQAVLNLETSLVAARDPEVGAALAQAMRSMRLLLVRLIADAQARGDLKPSVDASALASLLIAATGGIQTLSLQLGDELDIEATWRAFRQLLDGIRTQEVER